MSGWLSWPFTQSVPSPPSEPFTTVLPWKPKTTGGVHPPLPWTFKNLYSKSTLLSSKTATEERHSPSPKNSEGVGLTQILPTSRCDVVPPPTDRMTEPLWKDKRRLGIKGRMGSTRRTESSMTWSGDVSPLLSHPLSKLTTINTVHDRGSTGAPSAYDSLRLSLETLVVFVRTSEERIPGLPLFLFLSRVCGTTVDVRRREKRKGGSSLLYRRGTSTLK